MLSPMRHAVRSFAVLLFVGILASAACNGYQRLEINDPPPTALLSSPPPGGARAERVIVVSIDGLRADAIDAAAAATLQSLIRRGAFCPKAETIRPSITLPSHTAMLTGLAYDRHGVGWNSYRSGYLVHPSVFSVTHQVGMKSAMFFSKEKFHFLANPNCVDWIYGPPVPGAIPSGEEAERALPADVKTAAERMGRAFADAWPAQKWPLTFVHFREPDEIGHRKGWMGPEYIDGVKAVDRAIETMLAAIEKSGGFEKTALIVTADHGGSGTGHYRWLNPEKAENVGIPWICVGPGVPAGLKIDRVVHTFDTAPTALALLGLGCPEGIDGRPVAEVLR
jgi:arylsulfatase A-like enzyme